MVKYDKEILHHLPFTVSKSHFNQMNKGVALHSLDVAVQIVFNDTTIDHQERLKRLTDIIILSKRKGIISSQAFALGLSSVVLKELGQLSGAIKTAEDAIKIFKQIDHYFFSCSGLILCHSILGKSYNQLGLSKIGLDQFEMALTLLPSIDGGLGIPAFRVYDGISECYSALGNRDDTFHYLDKCLEIVNEHIVSPEIIMATKIPVLIRIAIENRKYNNLKKCMDCLILAKETLVDFKEDIIYREQLQREFCITFMEMGEFLNAESYLQNAMELNLKQKNNFNKLDNKCLLGELMIKLGNQKDALPIFLSILEDDEVIENNELLAKVHKNLSKLYEDFKEPEKIAFHSKKYLELLEKNYTEKHKILAWNKEEAIDRLMVELDVVRKEEENQRLQMEVDHKNSELTSKALFSASNRSFIEKFKSQLNNSFDSNQLMKLCDEKLKETQDWQDFKSRFNEVHPKFIHQLESKSSKLSAMEIKVCILIKMGFDTLEIAGLLWISKRGAEQHRYRISKKLNVKENLFTYLSSL